MKVFLSATIASAWFILFPSRAEAQLNHPPDSASLLEISVRGRRLASYDLASSTATDSVITQLPRFNRQGLMLGMRERNTWTFTFGELNPRETAFIVHFRSHALKDSTQFRIVRASGSIGTPRELLLARVMARALRDFGATDRPYNTAVLPAESGGYWVYLYPASLAPGINTHGGDVRYLVSADGTTILSKRRMHRSILEGTPPPNAAHGMHTAILDDLPEDTDVLYVLTRRPPMDEIVVSKSYVFTIHLDGSISWKYR